MDLLVNNAGVGGSGAIGEYSIENWQWMLSINLMGVIHGCHAMADWLKANSRGAHLLNVASVAGFLSAPYGAPYNVSKAGVISLSETLFMELAPHNVTVSVLCPGFFQTNIVEGGRFSNDALRQVATGFMVNAEVTAEQVAEAAVRSIRGRKLYVVEGPTARFYWRLKRFFPAYYFRSFARRCAQLGQAAAASEKAAV